MLVVPPLAVILLNNSASSGYALSETVFEIFVVHLSHYHYYCKSLFWLIIKTE